jgi:hypothetical protein
VTVFLGCGFAAKYRQGGGNFSVPLQWMLGLRRLRKEAVWLEYLPGSGDPAADQANIAHYQQQVREYGLEDSYCLLYDCDPDDNHDLKRLQCIGMSGTELLDRLAGPNVLLNLSYSIHPPVLLQFERRILCDLDPSEVFYWMSKLEMGQSHHQEFWTIGLNVGQPDCGLPASSLQWRTFYPLVDTELFRRQPRPPDTRFTTIGQWYWGGMVELDGEFPDLSKKFAFEPYIDLPHRLPTAVFELAMNINQDDPERERLRNHGWNLVDPHEVAATPRLYRNYLATVTGEFTAIKGVDVTWQTGWLSDRAAAFCALGRPVVTEDTGARKFLPPHSGLQFVRTLDQAVEAVRQVTADWERWSRISRQCAVEVFDSARNIRKILEE